MLPELSQTSTLLRDLSLFNMLEEDQIDIIAQLFIQENFNPDEIVLHQSQKAHAFYLILDGQAAAERRIKAGETQVDVFVRGDFFGEDSLLHDDVEPATITALTPLTLLSLEKEDFLQLIHDFPSIKDRLYRFIKSHQYLEKLHFNWLNEDEVVYQVRRRHIASLFMALALPAAVLTGGLIILGFAWWNWGTELLRNGSILLAAVVLGIGLGWAIWNSN